MQLHRAHTVAHRRTVDHTYCATAVPSRVRISGTPSSVQPLLSFSQRSHISRGPLIKLGAAPSSAVGTEVVEANSTDVRTLRIHYTRRDKRYEGWGLHVWGDAKEQTDWQRPLYPVGFNQEGVWFDVALKPGARFLGLQIHAGESKSARAELQISELKGSDELWLAGDEQQAFMGEKPSTSNLPVGSLGKQSAVWVSADVIAWRHDIQDASGARRFYLHTNRKGHLWVNGEGVQGSEAVWELHPVAPVLPPLLAEKYPYLAGCAALRVPAGALDVVSSLFRDQLAVSTCDAEGAVLDATGVQLQGGLDAHCTYDGPLGCFRHPETQKLMVAVWAPTAHSVQLLHYQKAHGDRESVLPMAYEALGRGVWSAELPDNALWSYYKYRVTVYHPESRKVEVSDATDPYSRSLAADGERTQVVLPDIKDPCMVPEGWSSHPSPPLERWTDISLYELCIRDFSSQDETVKPELRGKYLAFVPEEAPAKPDGTTSGLVHLASLREAGLNHLHLLPSYDFATVPERKENQKEIKDDLSKYAPDSDEQQKQVLAIADEDAFNWGYDPVHYGVPDGSYATDPDGPTRIHEYRRMVMALHQQGWRVVLDVVYNHVFAAGPQNRYSVLDKIVPGYYQRRFEDGTICQSTCCNNTATENVMCERLAIDDLVHWAQNYKVDGFRFDIMGHMMVSTLQKMRARLDELTLEEHGVDGKKIYIYGEAWDFGEVVNNDRGINCGQMNLAGTKLGAFNDRLRDGALGGGPFAPHDFQGFVTGLGLAPSGAQGQGDAPAQLRELAMLTDWIRVSLAGCLRQYTTETADGQVLPGEKVLSHGLPTGYGLHPCEHVAFIGCHDNMTMFDIITEKAPLTASAEERVRMQVMCLSLIILSQGIPFIHAGDDLLRSKSLDRDSYSSGDWFNGMDWTGQTHKLGIGLPPHTKNGPGWHYKRALLTNMMIRPTPDMLRNTAAVTQQLLRVRYSSPLFRLPSAEAICSQVFFHNTGPQQVPGVVVMELVSAGKQAQAAGPGSPDGSDVKEVYDPNYERVVVVFNAAPLEQEIGYPKSAGKLQLHPMQASPDAPDARARLSSADDTQRTFTIPARTTAVFVQPR